MKVLVTGGRNFEDHDTLFKELSALHRACPITLIVHGGARGADALADEWARYNSIPTQVFEADWEKHGRSAGPIRNREMLFVSDPDMVFAFSGGAGTADMIRVAGEAMVKVKYQQGFEFVGSRKEKPTE